jgi:hypothetical protein
MSTNDIATLRRQANALRDVLIHDCGNSDRCWCFGAADVAAYERAAAALKAAEATTARH